VAVYRGRLGAASEKDPDGCEPLPTIQRWVLGEPLA